MSKYITEEADMSYFGGAGTAALTSCCGVYADGKMVAVIYPNGCVRFVPGATITKDDIDFSDALCVAKGKIEKAARERDMRCWAD